MKVLLYILCLTIAVSLLSCKKILTVEQKMDIPNENAISSVKDLEAVLAGAYDVLQSGNVLGGNMVAFADLLADDAQVSEDKLSPFGTYEIFHRSTTVQIGLLRDMWRDSYKAINCVNNIISVIDNNKISGKEFNEKKNKIKGEALFIRGIVHFALLQFWALPYNVNFPGVNLQPGVPYRTLPTLSGFDDLSMVRNTVEEVYNKSITDLLDAHALLPSSTNDVSRSRPSKYACSAFLARIYFQKGDYANAKIYAQKIINAGGYELNDPIVTFKMSGNTYSSEGIFQLASISSDRSNYALIDYYVSKSGIAIIRGKFETKFMFNSMDSRIKLLNITSDNVFSLKWYESATIPQNVVLIRSAEMYLIDAESNAIAGDGFHAYQSYKALKQKRFGTNWVEEDFDESSVLLDSIRMERRREMIFEGDRYNTLRRLQQNLRGGIAWNDPSVLFKIPQEEMAGNPLMVQNP